MTAGNQSKQQQKPQMNTRQKTETSESPQRRPAQKTPPATKQTRQPEPLQTQLRPLKLLNSLYRISAPSMRCPAATAIVHTCNPQQQTGNPLQTKTASTKPLQPTIVDRAKNQKRRESAQPRQKPKPKEKQQGTKTKPEA
ncbi:hypothetical protein Ancab_040090 [Ancistrocladus abbreviatus]